ncbi:unnamed protein product, partial [Timema podura]|nr:unnamed protein product [Timema podura]
MELNRVQRWKKCLVLRELELGTRRCVVVRYPAKSGLIADMPAVFIC